MTAVTATPPRFAIYPIAKASIYDSTAIPCCQMFGSSAKNLRLTALGMGATIVQSNTGFRRQSVVALSRPRGRAPTRRGGRMAESAASRSARLGTRDARASPRQRGLSDLDDGRVARRCLRRRCHGPGAVAARRLWPGHIQRSRRGDAGARRGLLPTARRRQRAGSPSRTTAPRSPSVTWFDADRAFEVSAPVDRAGLKTRIDESLPSTEPDRRRPGHR